MNIFTDIYGTVKECWSNATDRDRPNNIFGLFWYDKTLEISKENSTDYSLWPEINQTMARIRYFITMNLILSFFKLNVSSLNPQKTVFTKKKNGIFDKAERRRNEAQKRKTLYSKCTSYNVVKVRWIYMMILYFTSTLFDVHIPIHLYASNTLLPCLCQCCVLRNVL